jgi:uncharacterized GH25 family protein
MNLTKKVLTTAVLLLAPAVAFAHPVAASHSRTLEARDHAPQAHIHTVSAHQGR